MECGNPTCMAFAMKVAQGAIGIEKCPHMSEESKAKLSEATAPPMKNVNIGVGSTEHTFDSEAVLFRQDKGFVSKNLAPEKSKKEFSANLSNIDGVFMDDIQKSLVKMVREQPSCTGDRKQLKAFLMDYLPKNKLQQNLILNAYDEDIVIRLKPSSDVTLHALQMVKILSDGYGLTTDAAMWSVISWCHMLKLNEVAEIIRSTFSTNPPVPSAPAVSKPSSSSKLSLGEGMYLVGADIAAGDIKLEPAHKSEYSCTYYIEAKNTYETIRCGSFKTQAYLTIKDGQYLKVSETVLLSYV